MTGLEKLLQRKLPADVFTAVREALDPEDLDYVPRSRLNDVIGERDTALSDLATLKKTSGNAADIQKKLDALQTKYDTDIAAKDAEIAGIHREHKITDKLNAAKAKNIVAVRALLNEDALGEDLAGLDKELERITQEDPYLFGTRARTGTGKNNVGAGEGEGGVDGSGSGSGEGTSIEEMRSAVFGGVY